ncbi:hypothetical protein L1049_008644 [Liquidambar formosana]|uniref:Uncharacterized protein n=1 Tax=Liquidambar formosana TaxID=63359 RepID=A0AAP0S6U5_LIQFO
MASLKYPLGVVDEGMTISIAEGGAYGSRCATMLSTSSNCLPSVTAKFVFGNVFQRTNLVKGLEHEGENPRQSSLSLSPSLRLSFSLQRSSPMSRSGQPPDLKKYMDKKLQSKFSTSQ